jgi:3D (Asp-Asp-Asp) domain-containing protein
MKILQIIREEVVPLSRRQGTVLLIIIACVFQFVLFYAPALADAAVKKANAQETDQGVMISNDSVTKEATMDTEAAKITTVATTTVATTTNKVEKVIKTSTHMMTAYNSEAAQTDDDPCTTANGFNLCKHGIEDTIAANFLPMGTRVKIPDLFGDRVFVVRDRMNQKHPNRVDVWMKDHQSAMNFGVKIAKIQVLE